MRLQIMKRRKGPFQTEPLTFELDEKELLNAAGNALLAHHKHATLDGVSPDTEARKRALDPRGSAGRALKAGTRGPHRGAPQVGVQDAGSGMGKFSKSLGKLFRDKKVIIAADRFFDQWLEREATRGVTYFEVTGAAETAMDKALQPVVDKAFA